jgi:uroporphyrinogen decarboxylase
VEENLTSNRELLNVLKGLVPDRPPIWLMRQAGRYLPEYRAIREQAGSFLDLCYNPELACEVTLQPIRRFDLDAAILFSDILVIPDALGQSVRFEQGEGPVLEPLDPLGIEALSGEDVLMHLQPVLETVHRVRSELSGEKTLLGFCGGPWTVATYMLGGRGSSDQAIARRFALENDKAFRQLMDVLIEASIAYLVAQLEAGADAVQVFESWASNLDERSFADYVIGPNRRIVAGVREVVPDAAIIGFPRSAPGMLAQFVRETGVDAVGLDQGVPLDWARHAVPGNVCVQGNLDPLRLVAGGEQMRIRAKEIVQAFRGRPHVFNLGHGIVPQTPPEHVAELVRIVRGA